MVSKISFFTNDVGGWCVFKGNGCDDKTKCCETQICEQFDILHVIGEEIKEAITLSLQSRGLTKHEHIKTQTQTN